MGRKLRRKAASSDASKARSFVFVAILRTSARTSLLDSRHSIDCFCSLPDSQDPLGHMDGSPSSARW
eukprot:scaffold529_cov308-Pinguiococcus_pyrenoidosus.AAC.41